MARGGINKAVVQKARDALLARGENPSIDAIRIELGNTGSKTTIHRYLKEIDTHDPRPDASRERLSDERSEEHTSELQSRFDIVCRLLLEKKKRELLART